jgi:integrase
MSRPRDRSSAEGLLPRMEARPWSDGITVSYRYHPVGGKPIALGTDKAAALQKVLDLTGKRDTYGTLRWVWEQYQEAARWLKLAEGTRKDYELAWRQIDRILGDAHIATLTSPLIARYVHIERKDSPRRADIEKSLLSRLFGHGIKLGVCSVNATIGVEPHGSEPRTEAPKRYVLAGFLAWIEQQTDQRQIIGMAAEYASLAGSRRIEFLDLSWPQVDEVAGVVRTKRAKQRGKKRGEVIELVEITPKLQALLDRLKAVRAARGLDCLYVFPTRGNNAYTARGFATLWQRCVAAAIEAKVIEAGERFTFHDLRAYYATVHKADRGELPDLHANPGTTARVYDRNKEVKRRAL